MPQIKPYCTYEEQIDILRDKGCIVKDEEFCKIVLTNINYYRLSAYFLPFKQNDGSYQKGTTFEKIYHIYEFDKKLRNLFLSALEVIEVSFRSRLSHFHASKYGPLGYKDPSTFCSKHNNEKFKENISREIKNNSKVLFVKHHIEHYDGQFPLWVIIELFTFGMLSYFYSDLKTADKKAIAGKNYKEMVSWFRCCTDLRNICAHYGRLYYRIFPALPKGFDISYAAKQRLWGAILSLKALYPIDKKWNQEFIPDIKKLFDEYKDDINLYHLAFPDDWLD